MSSLFDTNPDGSARDTNHSVARALEIVTDLPSMDGFVDRGDFDPKREAERGVYEEMNIFTLDGEKDERIPVDKIYETCSNPIVRVPTKERSAYVITVVLARLDDSLNRNNMKDLGEHFETSISELEGENQTRKIKIEVLKSRYTGLGRIYQDMDLSTPEGCFLKWVKDSFKEILSLLELGSDLAVATISWYRGCLERYTTTKNAGIYDLSTGLEYFNIPLI